MGRTLIFALLLIVTQALAVPVSPKFFREFDHYVVYRETGYLPLNATYLSLPECENTTDPRPITTPNPILEGMPSPVIVNFIIGSDGRVYEPFVLLANAKNEQEVLRAVKTWRFHPATCNGTPFAVEDTTLFSWR